MYKILLISAFFYLLIAPYSTAEHLQRHRRGASVYVTFPSGGGSGQESNSQSFMQYLGGTSGLYGSSSSSSGSGDNYFDSSNLANRYRYSGFADGDEGSVRNTRSSKSNSGSSSGWEPSTSAVNYGGSPSFSPYFGAVTPNFANSGGSGSSSSSSSCPGCPSSNTQPNPVSASGLLHSATSSFNAQTAVFNALTAGSNYSPYKGGRY